MYKMLYKCVVFTGRAGSAYCYLDLLIKLLLHNAVSMQSQSCWRMPTIEPTLSVNYEQ